MKLEIVNPVLQAASSCYGKVSKRTDGQSYAEDSLNSTQIHDTPFIVTETSS